MELFGKKIRNEMDLDLAVSDLCPEQKRTAYEYIHIQKQMEAEDMIKNEKDPKRKEEMQRLYNKQIYDFAFLFDPKNRK